VKNNTNIRNSKNKKEKTKLELISEKMLMNIEDNNYIFFVTQNYLKSIRA